MISSNPCTPPRRPQRRGLLHLKKSFLSKSGHSRKTNGDLKTVDDGNGDLDSGGEVVARKDRGGDVVGRMDSGGEVVGRKDSGEAVARRKRKESTCTGESARPRSKSHNGKVFFGNFHVCGAIVIWRALAQVARDCVFGASTGWCLRQMDGWFVVRRTATTRMCLPPARVPPCNECRCLGCAATTLEPWVAARKKRGCSESLVFSGLHDECEVLMEEARSFNDGLIDKLWKSRRSPALSGCRSSCPHPMEVGVLLSEETCVFCDPHRIPSRPIFFLISRI